MKRAIRVLTTARVRQTSAALRAPPRVRYSTAATTTTTTTTSTPPLDSSILDPPPSLNPLPETPSTLPRPAPLKLRSYQEECIQAVISHVDSGHRRMAISLATGSGKTVIFTQLISRLSHPTLPMGTSTLILAHRRELVQQAYDHCKRNYPHLKIEIEMADQQASGFADITVASVASIVSGERIEKYDPRRYKLILVDECHHAVAPRYLDVFAHFGLLEGELEAREEEKPILVGVSATMSRLDGLKLGKVFDYIVYHKDYVDMINEKWLSAVMFTTVKTHADLTKIRTLGGDFNVGELAQTVNTPQLNDVTVRAWAAKAGTRKSTLVFCVDIAHVMAMAETFRRYGVDARYVTSNTHIKDRKELLEDFKNGKYPVLVNCGIFTEGTDIPNIDCVLLARPTQSRNLIVQMIGRGMRLHPGKEDCHVIDMVGSVEQGIISVPTLLGLDPDELLDGASLAEVKEKKEKKEKEIQMSQPLAEADVVTEITPDNVEVTFSDYDSVHDLLADKKMERYVAAYTQTVNAWVCVGQFPMRWVLSCGPGGNIIVTKCENGLYSVMEHRKLPKEMVTHMKARPRKIMDDVVSLEAAIRGADTYAGNKFPRALLARNASWRKNLATEAQKKLIEKMTGKECAENLTRGVATDMMTRLKHGAKGWFDELKKIENRKQKQLNKAQKIEQMMKAPEIKVGKLDS